MADSIFTSNTASNSDDLNASLNIDPNITGEEATNENEGTISQSEEGVIGDTVVGNLPVNNNNDPFVSLEALTTDFNYDPSLPISAGNDPFMGYAGFAVNSDYSPVDGQTQDQQVFQEAASFDPTVGVAPGSNQVTTNLPAVEEENWTNLTNDEQDEAFQRLMEMSAEDFEGIMNAIPNEAAGPSSAIPYAIGNKRVRRDEDGSVPTAVESGPLEPQPAFEPEQSRQIRQIRAAKSQQGKAIEALQEKAQDLEAELAKWKAEANDAFENGRMMALLGLHTEWEAKEAKIKADAETEHQNQVGAIRTFLEGQIAEGKGREEKLGEEANSAFEHQRSQLEEAHRQLANKDQTLDQFRAEAQAYKANVEEEANLYKQVAEKELGAQRAALEAAEIAKTMAESHLSEKTRALALARSSTKDLETRIAELEEKQSADKAAQQGREEELERSGAEAAKALEGKIRDLEELAEEATRAKESSAQATESLNEELWRMGRDLDNMQLALEGKTDELKRARSALEEQTNAQKPEEPRETRSLFGPMEQINIEPSDSDRAKMPSVAKPFKFVATTEFSPSFIKSRQIKPMKSRRELQPQSHPQSQPKPEAQRRESKKEQKQEQEAEPTSTSPSQSGMFSRHFYPPSPATARPRRSQIHAEEAVKSRFRLPLDKIHTIISKLDQVGDWQDGTEDKAGLIISAELTGLSIDDLKVMQSLRMSVPASSPPRRNPRKVMSAAKLEIPITLVDLLATNDRPAIRAFLDGATFPQPSQASSADSIAGDKESRGTQTQARDAEAEGDMIITEGQGEVAVVELPKPKQTRGWLGSGVASLGKILIILFLIYLIFPLFLPSPWSSPAARIFEDPDPNSGWLNYEPEPSPWSNLLTNISGWPIISKILDIFFDLPDFESKWCGNIPIG